MTYEAHALTRGAAVVPTRIELVSTGSEPVVRSTGPEDIEMVGESGIEPLWPKIQSLVATTSRLRLPSSSPEIRTQTEHILSVLPLPLG